MRSPFTTDIEFLLVECHDALFSLFKSTGGLRLPNAGAQPLLEAGATQERRLEAVGCSGLLGQDGTRALPPPPGRESQGTPTPPPILETVVGLVIGAMMPTHG